LEENDLCLHVIFARSTYSRRKFELNLSDCHFQYTILNSAVFENANNEKTVFKYTLLNKTLKKIRPSCILVGGFSPATMKVWWYSKLNNVPYLIWSGSLLPAGVKDKFHRLLQRKFLIHSAAGFVAYGTAAKDYLIQLGAKKEEIEIGINTVDTRFFKTETEKCRLKSPSGDKKHLLYLGYLVPRKNVGRLLEVINLLAAERSDFVMDIIGDGDDRPTLEKYVEAHQLQKVVRFHGFRQKEELPSYLAATSIFMFQTDFDIWGLTLVETMSAGIPCISSINAGANKDLIREGETGFCVNFADSEAVLKLTRDLLDNPKKAAQIGKNAAQFIEERVSLKISAQGFVTAINKSLKTKTNPQQ
jgi:glycosyltransferase involved in cell wall biosynthesis